MGPPLSFGSNVSDRSCDDLRCLQFDRHNRARPRIVLELVELFRQIRAVTDGEATLKIFPSQASAFKLMHPDRLGEVVDCRVKPSLIRLTASKQHIPIRGNNKKLTSKQSPTSVASSAATPHREQFMQGLFDLAMGRREPSTSPPVDRRPQSQSEGVDRPRTQPIETPPPLADEGVNREVAVPIVEGGDGHVAPPPAVDAKVARRAHLDHLDGLMDGYLGAKKEETAMKKPAAAKKAAAKKAAKKAAKIGDEVEEEEEESSDEEEEEESIVEKAPCKPRSKADAKAKAASKKAATKTVAAKAAPASIKRPAAVGKSPPAKFPRVDENVTVYFGGGRLYKAEGGMVRVYPR